MTTKRQDFCNDHKIHHVHCSLIKANNGQKIDHIWTKALFKNIMNYNKNLFHKVINEEFSLQNT